MSRSSASDVRALSNAMLNAYLYPVAGWGVALAGLYVMGQYPYAIPLCSAVSIWHGIITVAWYIRTRRKVDQGELEWDELRSATGSIGQLLALNALVPAIVFMAHDPLAPESWGLVIGVVTVALLAMAATALFSRNSSSLAQPALLFSGWIALPLNTAGAITASDLLGLFDSTWGRFGGWLIAGPV